LAMISIDGYTNLKTKADNIGEKFDRYTVDRQETRYDTFFAVDWSREEGKSMQWCKWSQWFETKDVEAAIRSIISLFVHYD
jgi:hypothetical protein